MSSINFSIASIFVKTSEGFAFVFLVPLREASGVTLLTEDSDMQKRSSRKTEIRIAVANQSKLHVQFHKNEEEKFTSARQNCECCGENSA
jgi:hypothetical protein